MKSRKPQVPRRQVLLPRAGPDSGRSQTRLWGKKLLFVGFCLHGGYRSCLRVMCLNPPKWTALHFNIPRIPAACWHEAHSKAAPEAGRLQETFAPANGDGRCSCSCPLCQACLSIQSHQATRAGDSYGWGAAGESIWRATTSTHRLEAHVLPEHRCNVKPTVCWRTKVRQGSGRIFWEAGSPVTGGHWGGGGKGGLRKRTSYGGPLCLSPTDET